MAVEEQNSKAATNDVPAGSQSFTQEKVFRDRVWGTQKRKLTLRVLYLFAGDERKSGAMEQVKGLLAQWQLTELVDLEVSEWDILRGPQFDLSNTEIQAGLRQKARAGYWAFYLVESSLQHMD